MSPNSNNFARIILRLERGLRAEAADPTDPRSVTLADFIGGDVQASEKGVRVNLRGLDAVLSGKLETEGGTGNAFTVTISRDDVFIENAISDVFPSYHYTHEEFRTALEQVLTLLGKSGTDRSSDEEA